MRKPVIFLALAVLLPLSLFAQEPTKPDTRTEQLVREFIGDCASEMKMVVAPMQQKLPPGVNGVRVQVASDNPYCGGMYAVLSSTEGSYVGIPWPIGVYQGTIEEKIRQFAWEQLQSNYSATVDRTKKTAGFHPVQIVETTEHGKITTSAIVDPTGTLLFLGGIRPSNQTVQEFRLARLSSVLTKAPTKGSDKAPVDIIEFSDFQCPSCRHYSEIVTPILEKHAASVRYRRIDLPLLSAHPWALPAAVAGRAIYRQSPEAFWDFKKSIYANQDKLNTFMLDDFVQAFVKDHSLDGDKFNADVQSPALRQEILDSVGAAFSLPVFGTPTFLVNGEIVVPGEDGKNLEKAIEAKLKSR